MDSFRPVPRRTAVAAALVATALVAVGCTTSPAGSGAAGGTGPSDTITVATPPPSPEATMPQQGTTTNLFPIRGTVYESLIGFNATNGDHAVPMLATSWNSSDGSLTWTFHLRHGVQFQRGAGEFTSADVKFSWQLITKADSLSTDAQLYRTLVKSIDTPDKYTAVFHLASPVSLATKQVIWDTNLLIVSKSYYDKVGEQGYEQHPVGTGPYTLNQYDPGQDMEFSYFKGYWGHKPQFANLNLKFVSEDQTRMSMLQSGEADAADIPRVLVPSAKSAGLKVVTGVEPAVVPVLWFGSMYLPGAGGMPWADQRVREALNIGFDRNAIANNLLKGYAKPVAFSLMGPSSPGYGQIDRQPYPYNPTLAKQLLAQAGYGKGLTITLKVTEVAGVPEIQTVIEAIAAQWAQIGVTAKIQPTEQAPISQAYRQRDKLNYIFTTRNPYNAFDPASLFSLLFDQDGAFGGTDKATSQLVKQAAATSDSKQLATLYARIAQQVYDGYWQIPLPAVTSTVAINPKRVSSWTGTFAYGFDGLTTFTRAG